MASITALAAQLGAILQAQNLMLVLAESCTGGMVSQYVTSIPGSSMWFDRAYITYSNQAKIEMLNVSHQTLKQYGAVSEQVAIEMAHGAFNISHNRITNVNLTKANLKSEININTTVAASITGIAGPSLEHKLKRSNVKSQHKLSIELLVDSPMIATIEKPIGLVCFAFSINHKVIAHTQHFKGTRRQIRLQATEYVLTQLIHLLK